MGEENSESLVEVIEPAEIHSTLPAQAEDAQTDAQDTPKVSEEPVAKTFTQAELDAIVQRRVIREAARTERRIDQMHRETLDRLAPRAAQEPQDDGISRDAYASDAEWIDAKVERRFADRDAQAQAARQQQQTVQLIQTTEQIYSQAEKIAGFDRETFDELPLTPTIASAIMSSDIAPQIMAYLATNPADAERLALLSNARQAAEIGKLEVRLTEAPRVSKAPPPITTTGNGRSSIGDLEAMSPQDFYESRRKQGARYFR